MNFKELNPPIIELPAHQIWHRIQRKTARSDSVRKNGFVLAPSGGLVGRFDLANEPTAYLGDSPETALYESLFRREVRSCHWDRLQQRVLTRFETLRALRLVDLRGLEERYPVLQSLRYEATQGFAQDCRHQELNGILYASAQHPYHGCVCLFQSGIEKAKRIFSIPLVKPGTELALGRWLRGSDSGGATAQFSKPGYSRMIGTSEPRAASTTAACNSRAALYQRGWAMIMASAAAASRGLAKR